MQQKHLILVTDNYPIGLGEFFLNDEMQIAQLFFEKIIVIVPKEQYQVFEHHTSSNIFVYQWSYKRDFRVILSSIPFVLSFVTINEIFRNRKGTKFINTLKIALNDVLKSSFLMNEFQAILTKEKLNPKESIFYSYWHDYKALALARFRQKTDSMCISRAHSSDIFYFRSSFNYLPYKKFILENLNKTFSISESGRLELQKYIVPQKKEKIEVSRLGKKNEREPLLKKTGHKIIICSCSHFNHLKRVHFIPKILKKVKIPNIHWVHFGWGYTEYEKMVHDELQDAKFTFELKGKTENEIILDYYSSNFVDLFINLSTHEGIPVSIMEAFSAAIPVLATDVGGVSEIVNENCGFLIEKEFKIDLVAKKLEEYLMAPREIQIDKRKKARLQWQNKYNAQKNYHDFYKQLLINGN